MAEKVNANELGLKLAEILDSWPLYRRFQWVTFPFNMIPPVVELFCHLCHKRQLHQLTKDSYTVHGQRYSEGQTEHRQYICRNCDRGIRHFLLAWTVNHKTGISSFSKIGQWPAVEEDVPAIMEKTLSPGDLDLYRKAIRSRNSNFGLGAMGYMRRVVESRMNELLDLIADELEQSPEQKAQLEEVKRGWQFSKKVEYAAGIIPKGLKPGGMNPINILHDVASDGLHNLPEGECIALFDKARAVFEFVYRELQVKKEDAERFARNMRELTDRKKPTED